MALAEVDLGFPAMSAKPLSWASTIWLARSPTEPIDVGRSLRREGHRDIGHDRAGMLEDRLDPSRRTRRKRPDLRIDNPGIELVSVAPGPFNVPEGS
jgi:hypothetical protein